MDKLKIHFIGIGGSSMNGLALIMKNKGNIVTGSDAVHTAYTDYLEEQGIKVYIPQCKENIDDYDLVVYTAAISEDNEELMEAKKRGIPCVDRATFLGKITNQYGSCVGVAGCHGKTTITSMIALVATKLNPSPTVHVGGSVPFLHGGTHIGESDLFITEACEYVNSYLKFHVTTAVINNIDDDHLDFFGDIEHIYESFLTYANNIPKSGLLIANISDPLVKKITQNVGCNVETYSVYEPADWQATNIVSHEDATTTFDILRNGNFVTSCLLNIPGRYNVQNALAAIVVCNSLGIPVEQTAKILEEYKLTKRRFEYYGKMGEINMFHDYAHHPTELDVCIETAKSLPHEKLKAIFQCHTYSRAINLLDKYAESLKVLDEVIVPDIYAAREKNTGEIHAKDIVNAINEKGGNAKYIATFEEIKEYFADKKDNKDLLLCLGPGDIGEKCKILLND